MTSKLVSRAVFAAHDAPVPADVELAPAPNASTAKPVQESLGEPEQLDAGAVDVMARMRRSGASESFAEEVAHYVHRKGLRGPYAIDGAAALIGKLFHRARSPKRGVGPARIVFVGPTGAGKTACIAKLGRLLSDSGRSVAFASLDPLGMTTLERIGSLDADRDRTEIPLAPISKAVDLEALLAGHTDLDLVLVDTPGISPSDTEAIDELASELGDLARIDPLDCYLVLPAHLEGRAADFIASAFSRLGPTGAIVTKLDETDAPCAVLEAIQSRRLPVAFLSDGQDVRGHLTRPKTEHFADLFLRGRCSL